jgi:hypothetical protein
VPTADALASVEKSSSSIGPTPDLKGEYFCIENDDPSLLECMLHHPDPAMIPFPLDYGLLAQQQHEDQALQQQHQNKPLIFPLKTLGQHQLICYQPELQTNWKIAIPTSMLHPIITWYHETLSHIGSTRLYQTINTHFAHPDLWLSVEQTV